MSPLHLQGFEKLLEAIPGMMEPEQKIIEEISNKIDEMEGRLWKEDREYTSEEEKEIDELENKIGLAEDIVQCLEYIGEHIDRLIAAHQNYRS